MTSRKPPIDSLTSLRGLAALWVVLHHFGNDLITLLPAARSIHPFIRLGNFAVPIFFILSGYVITYNYLDQIGERPTRRDLLRFWGRRLARIYPLHLASLLAVLAMVVVAKRLGLNISRTDYSRRDFVLNLLLMQTWVPHFRMNWNYPAWSVSSEWFAYLFFPLACPVLVRVRRTATLLGLGLAAYLLSIFLQLFGDRVPYGAMLAVVGPFLLGCILARMVGLGFVPRENKGAAWAFSIALLLLPFVAPPIPFVFGLTAIGAALVFVLGAAGNDCPRPWTWRPIVALGDVSYSLYMVHALVQKVVEEAIPAGRFAHRSPAMRLTVVGIYLAAISLATWLAHRLIDDYFRRALRRLLPP